MIECHPARRGFPHPVSQEEVDTLDGKNSKCQVAELNTVVVDCIVPVARREGEGTCRAKISFDLFSTFVTVHCTPGSSLSNTNYLIALCVVRSLRQNCPRISRELIAAEFGVCYSCPLLVRLVLHSPRSALASIPHPSHRSCATRRARGHHHVESRS